MKQIILMALGACLLLGASCKKSKESATTSPIAGTWELRSSQHSIIPTIHYPAGNDSLLQFTDTRYTVYSKGQAVKTGTYELVVDSSYGSVVVPGGKFTHRIIYDGDTSSEKKYLQLSGATLSFAWGEFAVDGGTLLVYQKIWMED